MPICRVCRGGTRAQALHGHGRPLGSPGLEDTGWPETNLGLYSWIGRLGLHILEQGSKEGRALELGFCRMNRTAQKQTNTPCL